MDEKKIEYLKKHLEEALLDDNFNEVNSCYQELLKFLNVADIPDLTQKVNDYNKSHSKKPSQGVATSAEDIKRRTRIAKKRYNNNAKISLYGIAGGFVAMILGFFLVMSGAGVFGSYNDHLMYGGLAVTIAGVVAMIIGTVFIPIKNKSETVLLKCRSEVFRMICEGESKLKYLKNVETIENTYVGQIKNDDPHGFGVGVSADSSIYIGEWKSGSKSGIGKLITDDMLMTLEGEFKADQANGVVDIQWEDGREWHGEYKDGMPWNGKGKTLIMNHVQEGVWKNGIKVQ